VCLGARLGTEVMALHKLGHFAVGIDLNPGPDNEYVLKGDFHKIVFPDGSLDAAYCNALDHVYDLERVLAEVRRLLRPGGIFVADIIRGYEEGLYAGRYESVHWRNAGEFAEKVARLSSFALESTRDLGQINRDRWFQAVFRKPAVDMAQGASEKQASDSSR
jgi:ubiquinone/menaquinone biosynthesis C-methylase UbiE